MMLDDNSSEKPKGTKIDYEKYAYRGFVKNVFLYLPEFKFHHKPFDIDPEPNEGTRAFVGRGDIEQNFLNILKNSTKTGAYLVTGFRGMGKTSFVNNVIRKYINEKESSEKRIKIINISLNQDRLLEIDIFRQIASELKIKFKTPIFSFLQEKTILPFTTSLIFVLITIIKYWKVGIQGALEVPFTQQLSILLISFIFSIILFYLIKISFRSRKNYRIYKKLTDLIRRCDAEVTKESTLQGGGAQFPLGFILGDVRKYPRATSKEVESELIEIIKVYSDSGGEIIVIFDELDKVDPAFEKRSYLEEIGSNEKSQEFRTYLNDFRERKQLIIDILASLKHFITKANARFVFIAGREMFDAAMADIADRQSLVSSIFHHVFYVDSFLKDKTQAAGSTLTNLIEEYMRNMLLPKSKLKGNENELLLRTYYNILKCKNEQERRKIIFALQKFIIYITYRSNGSPQKVGKLVEKNIVKLSKPQNINLQKNIVVSAGDLGISSESKGWFRKERDDGGLYLKISYYDQYRFSFISYLYRPFILSFGKYIKDYSDHILVSTPYLMDHLIKFHPFAFSIHNLELLPEILSTNKTPLIRFFIEELVSFLGQNLLRETEVGLFEYTFFNKVFNEISYLSKVFENESAAFNFTLDESYFTKLHLRFRIKELRNAYKKIGEEAGGAKGFIYSISFLNSLLGDAHFFDQEYNDAVVAYYDAIQALSDFTFDDENKPTNIEKYVLVVQNKLKLGLSYEKMNAYDLAMTLYSDIFRLSEQFYDAYYSSGKNTNRSFKDDALQLTIQGLLSELYLYEKLSAEGVSIKKIDNARNSILTLHEAIPDSKVSHLLMSKFNTNVGTLMFYKNIVIPKNDMEQAQEIFNFKISKKFDQEILNHKKYSNLFRFSPYPFWVYAESLSNIIYPQKDLEFGELINECVNIIQSNNNLSLSNFNKAELNNIGNLLTRIGDVILSYIPKPGILGKGERQEYFYLPGEVFPDPKTIFTGTDWHSELTDDPIVFFDNLLLGTLEANREIIHISFLVKLYYLSSRFYMRAGRSVSCSFQLRKILHVIRSTVWVERVKEDEKVEEINQNNLFELLEKGILTKILEIISWNSNSSDRPQIEKYKYYFGKEGNFHPPEMSKNIFTNVSNSPEIKEALLFFTFVKIKSRDFSHVELDSMDSLICFDEQSLVNSFNGISSQFSRLLELSFQATINKVILKTLICNKLKSLLGLERQDPLSEWEKGLFWKFKRLGAAKFFSPSTQDEVEFTEAEQEIISQLKKLKESKNDTYDQDEIPYLDEVKKYLNLYVHITANSIFCLTQVIKIINLSGVSYMLSNSYLADFHRRLSVWLKHYSLCRELDEFIFQSKDEPSAKIDMLLTDLIGTSLLRTLAPTSQAQLALQFYYKAIQVHNEGVAYKEQVKSLIYLEDDFNDNLYHYCAAIERQQINSGRIRHYVTELNKEIRRSQLLELNKYMNLK